jgi:beta-phosphoglucomutase-like phosphatase (HAD superfamily)
MTECTCGGNHAKSVDEEIVESEDVELAAGLDEPVEVGKEEALMKDMEATLAKLKEVLAYLEDMGEEKAELDEEEEEEEEEEDEEEEEKMEEEEKADTVDELHKAVTTLKKHGIGVYTGKKTTPAPKNDTPKAESIDWNNMTKSWKELEANIGDN